MDIYKLANTFFKLAGDKSVRAQQYLTKLGPFFRYYRGMGSPDMPGWGEIKPGTYLEPTLKELANNEPLSYSIADAVLDVNNFLASKMDHDGGLSDSEAETLKKFLQEPN